jgi:hypothetical protein
MLQGLQSTKRDAYGRLILGDIITSVNGTKVTNGSDLYRILDQCKVGEKVWCFHFFNVLMLSLYLFVGGMVGARGRDGFSKMENFYSDDNVL